MRLNMHKQAHTALAVGILLGIGSACFGITSIPATNLNSLDLGDLVAGPQSMEFVAPPPQGGDSASIGKLVSEVYLNGGVWTYTHSVSPTVEGITTFNSGYSFPLLGFTGVAGWDYGEALGSGGAGDSSDFAQFLTDDTQGLLWEADGSFFGSDDTITFFYQSSVPPSPGWNAAIHGVTAPAIPEPATAGMLALAVCIGAVYSMRRTKRG